MAKSRITGADKYSKRLAALTSAKLRKDVGRAVYVGADSIRVEARRLIADGAIQGAGHVPSAPGEPPNWDTGVLANNITTQQVGDFVAEATSSAPYAAALEYGTYKMEARPYMAPAASNKREEVMRNIQKVYSGAIVSVGRT